MNADNVIQKHSRYAVLFLENASAVMTLLLDRDYMVLESSDSFSRTTGQEQSGRYLGDILKPLEEKDRFHLAISQPGALIPQMFRLLGMDLHLKCFCFRVEEGYLIFAERLKSSDEEAVIQMSSLNNELYELTMQLTKKNRQLEKANQRIKQLMRTDPLTGLANRRFFNERFDEAAALARRHGVSLSVVVADLDFFKSVNDNFGHDAGDRVLMSFAEILRENCRKEDVAVRFGGEEFLVLLVGSGLEEALEFAERIRSKIEQRSFCGGRARVTASLGAAQLEAEDDRQGLIRKADEAMYRAKKAGRNRCLGF